MTNATIMCPYTGKLQIGSGKAFFIQEGVKSQVLIHVYYYYNNCIRLGFASKSYNAGQVLYKIVSKLSFFLQLCVLFTTV